MASVGYEVNVRRDHVEFHRNAPDLAPVRMIDEDEARQLLPPFYERVYPSTPGFYDRSTAWWEHRVLADEEHRRGGASAYRFAVAGGKGIDGYVQYRVKENWADGHGEGEVLVRELFGTTPESWAGLWNYALNQDLVARTSARIRSGEDPLFDLLAGTRRAQAKRSDSLWVRIMDVPHCVDAPGPIRRHWTW